VEFPVCLAILSFFRISLTHDLFRVQSETTHQALCVQLCDTLIFRRQVFLFAFTNMEELVQVVNIPSSSFGTRIVL